MPSGVTGDQEKRTPWLAGQGSVRRVGQDLAPWCLENPNDAAAGQRGRGYPPLPSNPPTGSNLLLSSSIMVTPWPQASYLQKTNGHGRSHMRLRGGAALPAVVLVAGIVRRGESASNLRTQRARSKREPLKSDRSPPLSSRICIRTGARCMQYACQACSWQRSRHTIGANRNINKQRKPV